MAREDYDHDRLVACWELGEDYDDKGEAPWEQPDESATNSVAGGSAYRIGRAILVEESSGVHRSFLYPDEAHARVEWPFFVRAYGEPEGEDG